MATDVADVGDLAPGDFRLRCFRLVRQPAAGLGNTLQAAFDGIAQHGIGPVGLDREPFRPTTNALDVVEHVRQMKQRIRRRHQKILMASFTIRSRTSGLRVSRPLTSTGTRSASPSKWMILMR